MGYSIGRWESDALVVDSSGFREGGWLDRMGHPHSADLHLIERFRRLDVGHLEIDVNDRRSPGPAASDSHTRCGKL